MEINSIKDAGAGTVPPQKTAERNEDKNEQDSLEPKIAVVNNEAGKSDEAVSASELKEHVEQINQVVELYHKDLKFQIHEASKRVMIEVVNTETQEVIREIPPKGFLDWVGKFHDLLGAIIDTKI